MSGLFDKTTAALQTSINMRQMRHNLTASNIANAETPGYHAKKLDFEEALARAIDLDGTRSLNANHPDHFATGGANPSVRARPLTNLTSFTRRYSKNPCPR